jgi:hypothetical protein
MVKLAPPIRDEAAWGKQVIDVDEALIEFGPWDMKEAKHPWMHLQPAIAAWCVGASDVKIASLVLHSAMWGKQGIDVETDGVRSWILLEE